MIVSIPSSTAAHCDHNPKRLQAHLGFFWCPIDIARLVWECLGHISESEGLNSANGTEDLDACGGRVFFVEALKHCVKTCAVDYVMIKHV